MPRLSTARLETLAWGLAVGMGQKEATRLAGYSWGGYAWTRIHRKNVQARIKELAPLVAVGAGPDEESQALAELALAARADESPEGMAAAARIARLAFAARKRALAALQSAVDEPEAQLPSIRIAPVTLSLEAWLAEAAAEAAPA